MSKNMKKNTATANVDEHIPAGMVQYLEIKSRHPDMLLFYRMGDFYELFFDDAVSAASILDIALTKRGTMRGEPIPMCGVPVHSSDNYLEKLIASGEKVAICEQLETPQEARARGYKAIMHRDVVRIVTAGTIMEAGLLNPTTANYLASLAYQNGEYAFAYADISTGEFGTISVSENRIAEVLYSYNPSELLVAKSLLANEALKPLFAPYQQVITPVNDDSQEQDFTQARQNFEKFYDNNLEFINDLSKADTAACNMLCDYISVTQKQFIPRLSAPFKQNSGAIMQVDAATKRNLEINQTISGEKTGSLLHVLDATVSNAGARLLSTRLNQPLSDKNEIEARLDAVEWGINCQMRSKLRESLRNLPDLERALGRLHTGKESPRDMVAINNGLQIASFIKSELSMQLLSENLPKEILQIENNITIFDELTYELKRALIDEPPMLARDGNFVKHEYHPSLDEFRRLRDESKRFIAQMQATYATQTNIPSLKIKHNNVLGYFVEIAKRFEGNITSNFIHRQTISDCLRYSTVELGELEHKILHAADKVLKIELDIFAELKQRILEQSEQIVSAARAIACLDLYLSFAEIAHTRQYVRPIMTNNKELQIVQGRHPVVEEMQKRKGENFIHNDCSLGDLETLWLITGPNMAGKSTFLRQNALIAIMAHMGCYVPASIATIGVIDKCFSRVGAADDLARGHSTFMVEMVETATILNQATSRSLVILDEIGRGTATYDGMAIAWAVVEHLHNQINCLGLFATHYHELTKLTNALPALSCYTMQVKEWRGEVRFLHQVVRGVADRSYGVHVAALAGVPANVVKRAKYLLQELEKQATNHQPLPLFETEETQEQIIAPPINAQILEVLQSINLDDLTPKAALAKLYELREMIDNVRG